MIKLREIADEVFGSPIAYWRNILQIITYKPKYKKIASKWIPLSRQEKLPNKKQLKDIQKQIKFFSKFDDKDKRVITKIDTLLGKM